MRRIDYTADLAQSVADTSRQLRELAAQIADLVLCVKVEDVKRGDLERRIETLETGVSYRRQWSEQRQASFGLAAFSAIFGALSAIALHFVFR